MDLKAAGEIQIGDVFRTRQDKIWHGPVAMVDRYPDCVEGHVIVKWDGGALECDTRRELFVTRQYELAPERPCNCEQAIALQKRVEELEAELAEAKADRDAFESSWRMGRWAWAELARRGEKA